MFRSCVIPGSCHKNGVIKKLLRLANADSNSVGGDCDAPGSEAKRARSAAAAKRLIRRLSVAELEDLLRVVEQRGKSETCAGGRCVVTVPRSRGRSQPSPPQQQRQPPPLVFATLRLFRWPDLGDDERLRRLPMCGGGGDDDEELGSGRCCNPYHWSRVGKFIPNYKIDSKYMCRDYLKPHEHGPFKRLCSRTCAAHTGQRSGIDPAPAIERARDIV